MYYPEETVEEVRTRNDIVDVVGSYVRLTRRGANYVGLCPFHSEKTGSFSVNRNLQIYKCFGCGKAGNVFTFIMEYESFTFVESLKLLADRAGVRLPETELSAEEKRNKHIKDRLLEINLEAAKFFYYRLREEQGRTAYDYLINRKLSDTTINSFGLGYAGKYSDGLYVYLKDKGYDDEILSKSGLVIIEEKGAHDRFWNRVMFPIMDANGKVIAFGGRIMSEAKNSPKYLNSPETRIFDKSRNLYGLNMARKSRSPYMLLCEGYMDVIALHQAGFTNAVASLGTAFTGFQAHLLSRYVKEAVITYDSDEAGTNAAIRAIPILKEAGISVRVLNMKPYKDPDEFIKNLGTEEYRKRIDTAVNAFYFAAETMRDRTDITDPDRKTDFDYELAAMLADIGDEIARKNYIDAAAKRYNIDVRSLERQVNRIGNEKYNTDIARTTVEREKKQNAEKPKAEDGIIKSRRLLLTWLVTEKEVYQKLEGIIFAQDFTEEPERSVAEMIFREIKETGGVIPAKIINRFEDAAEQALVTALFTADIRGDMNESERRKAFADTVIRVKRHSLEQQKLKAVEGNDVATLQKLISEQKGLEKLHKSLNNG